MKRACIGRLPLWDCGALHCLFYQRTVLKLAQISESKKMNVTGL